MIYDSTQVNPLFLYFIKVLKLAKQLGATGVIMEYEEMFPFEGKLAAITAENAYSKEDIKKILDRCEEYEFTVIPLIQTFGKLSYLAKLALFHL